MAAASPLASSFHQKKMLSPLHEHSSICKIDFCEHSSLNYRTSRPWRLLLNAQLRASSRVASGEWQLLYPPVSSIFLPSKPNFRVHFALSYYILDTLSFPVRVRFYFLSGLFAGRSRPSGRQTCEYLSKDPFLPLLHGFGRCCFYSGFHRNASAQGALLLMVLLICLVELYRFHRSLSLRSGRHITSFRLATRLCLTTAIVGDHMAHL